jgi:DEAD/DEAH box helicase domain-containing protein
MSTLQLSVRTLVAGRVTQVEAHADELVGAVRTRAAAALQLAGGSRLLCLGAPVSDEARVGDLRSPALLLLPVAASRRSAAPAPSPAARPGGSLLRRSYVQERCCEDAPAVQPDVTTDAVLAELLAETRSAAASRADDAPAQTLDEAVRCWGAAGEDAAARAEAALTAALEAEPAEQPAQKRRKRAPAAAAKKRTPAAPAPPAWWQREELAALPLPPELAALAREFAALSAACAFLQTQHVSATSATAASVLQLDEDAAATRLGVMAALAPGLVRLRRLPREADGEEDEEGGGAPTLSLHLADPARLADVRVAATGHAQHDAALVACARSSVRLGESCCSDARRGWDAPSTLAAQQLLARQAAAFHACCVHASCVHQARAASTAGLAAWDAEAQGAWHAQLQAPTLRDALAACAQDAAAPPAAARAAAACANDPRRCSERTALDCTGLLAHLRASLGSHGSVVHVEALPARAARTAELPPHAALPAPVRDALARAGASRLFTHQVAALTAAAEGRHVAVATSTASGKSLCYAAPVLAAAACGATSLLLFPTKALAQDQLRALRALLAPPFPCPPLCAVYDGDTPDAERAHLRDAGHVLLTNPDMLHASILPSHACFARFLSRLAFVVVDEAHAYGGAFGSHTSLVLRRLRRLAARYGAAPRFIFTSATVANPVRHAAALAGLPLDDIALVDDDGSPCGPKDFVLWNPPLLHGGECDGDDAGVQPQQAEDNAPAAPARARGKAAIAAALRGERGAGAEADAEADANGDAEAPMSAREWVEQRRTAQASRRTAAASAASAAAAAGERTRSSAIFEVGLLLAECVQHGLSCLAFCKSRKLAELVFMYARDVLAASAPDAVPALACYRAGYTPEARRDLERRLFCGELRGVAATNALELGVDVGSLDVVLTLGFPGSIASLWQQSGRAGRREQRALHVYVAFDSPLDASLFTRPAWLFSRRPEAAAVDPSNARVLAAHAACAAFEAPLHEQADVTFFGEGLAAALAEQRSRGRLGRASPASGAPDGAWAFIGAEPGGPARGMSLRCVDEARWSVRDTATGAEIESLEESKAFFSVYEGAVLLHQGASYMCTALEHATRTARVRRADVAYYTAPQDSTRVTPAAGCAAGAAYAGGAQRAGAQCASATVTTRVTGYTKRWRRSGIVFDAVPLHLPEVTWHTVAAWVRVPDDVRDALAQLPGDADVAQRLCGGMHAAAHALATVLPLHVTCAPSDVATECHAAADARARPLRLLLYDRMSGGSGVCAATQRCFAELLAAAASLVEECDCGAPGGCVACVQSLTCGEHNAVLDRPAAACVLRAALAALPASVA